MTTTKYTVDIPASAVIVSTWDEFYKEGAKYPDTAVFGRYGGYVVEVGGEIKMATDDYMTEQVAQKLASIEKRDKEGGGAGVEQPYSDGAAEKEGCDERRCGQDAE